MPARPGDACIRCREAKYGEVVRGPAEEEEDVDGARAGAGGRGSTEGNGEKARLDMAELPNRALKFPMKTCIILLIDVDKAFIFNDGRHVWRKVRSRHRRRL